MSLFVGPEAQISNLAWRHTFFEFDNEIFSIVILHLPLIQEEYVVSFISKSMCSPISPA